jgi:hypothetical protein
MRRLCESILQFLGKKLSVNLAVWVAGKVFLPEFNVAGQHESREMLLAGRKQRLAIQAHACPWCDDYDNGLAQHGVGNSNSGSLCHKVGSVDHLLDFHGTHTITGRLDHFVAAADEV